MANKQLESERTSVSTRVRVQTSVDVSIPSQRDLAFKTFGVLPEGEQRKGRFAVALVINGTLIGLAIWISALTATHIKKIQKLEAISYVPVKPAEPPPPPPKLPPPPKIKVQPPPPPPDIPKIEVPEPPKITPPVIKPAPVEVKTPPAPKAVTPPPAPKPVAINIAQAASVANNDPHPSAIRLGSQTNPINNTAGPAVSPVNLGRSGAPGMPAGNTGLGPASKISIAGSGAPNGSMGGTGTGPKVIGLSNGIPGSNGQGAAKAGAIAIAQNHPQAIAPVVAAVAAPAKTPPKLLSKPKPEYTDEARQMHLEGTVYVKIHVSAAGSVSVVGIQSGLGHGLDQQATRVCQGMRFQPATANGQPTDWDGVVNVTFQLAS